MFWDCEHSEIAFSKSGQGVIHSSAECLHIPSGILFVLLTRLSSFAKYFNFHDALLSFLNKIFSEYFRQISRPFSMFSNTKHNIFNGLELMFGLAVKDGGLHFPANDDKPAKPWTGPQH